MKLKVTLQQLRKLDIWEEVENPITVYHFTSKENAEKIIQDRKVK